MGVGLEFFLFVFSLQDNRHNNQSHRNKESPYPNP
jgi:hypothetical protein